MYTDGAPIDSKLPQGCQSLGWSSVVFIKNGEVIASACGNPPRWVDTIQGAELWAVLKALMHCTFPAALYTDCDTVRRGSRQGPEWAGSSKRRYARIWRSIYDVIEESPELIHWMPAHLPESRIDDAWCSDGSVVNRDKWAANQCVDVLAKREAEAIRLPSEYRSQVLGFETWMKQLLIYLGQLTFEANHHQSLGGVMRDSEAIRLKRKVKKHKVKKKMPSGVRVTSRIASGVQSASSSRPIRRRVCGYTDIQVSASASASAKRHKASSKRVLEVLEARRDHAFQLSWREERDRRESRDQSMQPRPPEAPTAKQRIEALRQRVVARAAIVQGGSSE